ncbi:unnamed protein product [Heterobilharzia americana]|nr:unnamed protein product [Heterobilharzia americana]
MNNMSACCDHFDPNFNNGKLRTSITILNNIIPSPSTKFSEGKCLHTKSKAVTQSKLIIDIKPNDEEELKSRLYEHGPVSAGINVERQFMRYKNGIYQSSSCSAKDVNHAVLIVGYGHEDGIDYWIIKIVGLAVIVKYAYYFFICKHHTSPDSILCGPKAILINAMSEFLLSFIPLLSPIYQVQFFFELDIPRILKQKVDIHLLGFNEITSGEIDNKKSDIIYSI